MRFSDIKMMTKSPSYHVNVSWRDLDRHLEDLRRNRRLELEPPFQRSHVWTKEEQISFVEYGLKGGLSGRNVYLNARRWGTGEPYPLVLVDGLQRITAVLAFLNDEIPAFGTLRSEYEDDMHYTSPCFEWFVNDLPSMHMVVDWYVELNSTGRPHTVAEIDAAIRYRETLQVVNEYYSASSGKYLGFGPYRKVGTVFAVDGLVHEVVRVDDSDRDSGLIRHFVRREL